jgi:hypothetical protein
LPLTQIRRVHSIYSDFSFIIFCHFCRHELRQALTCLGKFASHFKNIFFGRKISRIISWLVQTSLTLTHRLTVNLNAQLLYSSFSFLLFFSLSFSFLPFLFLSFSFSLFLSLSFSFSFSFFLFFSFLSL